MTCSWLTPSRPSTHVRTISFVAPAPVGAPFAMSTLGEADRSSRAPPTPSITHRNPEPSNCTRKHVSTARPMCRGLVHVWPPSKDLIMIWEPWRGIPTANCSANTYTTPWLSVRTVQPERPKPCFVLKGLLLAVVTCLLVQV